MQTEAPETYPHEKDASFALFHFTSSVDAIEKLVTEGINKASADEIEQYQNNAKQSTDDIKIKLLANPGFTHVDPKLSPPKALCCSLAISSPVQEDQLKIKFYNNHSVNFKGVGVVIEDPKKVLVPHADYYAYRSGGILPLPLTKVELLGFKDFEIKGDGLRKRDEGLNKPVRMGVMARISLGVDSVTNYASWSRKEKRVLENRGGENGFLNFAKNFYRTSMCGMSKHGEKKFARTSKYYPLDTKSKKRPEASLTELLVYQKTGEENPIAGVVLDMRVLTLNEKDLNELKQLFQTNPNLALYIYDARLEHDCIRKIEDQAQIQDYLNFIETKATVLKFSSDEIAQKNQILSVFDNKILATDDLAPAPAPAIASARAPEIKAPKEQVKDQFQVFFKSLDSQEKVIDFLKFLWGGDEKSDHAGYDDLKVPLVEILKDQYTGEDREKKLKASKLINETNREGAIEKLMELNRAETDPDKKLKTEKYIATYCQIYRQHKLDIFLEQDEFKLGKQEMLTFVETKDKSDRLKKIDELKRCFEGDEIKDTEILSFFREIQNQENNQSGSKKNLREIWDKHEEIMKRNISNSQRAPKDDYADNLKVVARRDFLLLAIHAMENQEHKAHLEQHVKANYKEGNFLKSFGDLVASLEASDQPYPDMTPKDLSQDKDSLTSNSFSRSNQEGHASQSNEWEDIKPYISGGAIIGGFGGGLIGGSLCVSALGVGAILSTPIIMPVVVGVAVGVGVGVVGGVVAGTIVKKANVTRLEQTSMTNQLSSKPPQSHS